VLSLLNILSCRIQNNPPKTKITGEVLILNTIFLKKIRFFGKNIKFYANNRSFSSFTYPRFGAYVMQNDVLFPTLTPRGNYIMNKSIFYA